MPESGINDVRIYNRTLSPREVRLLADWERERRLIVTLQDIAKRVGDAAAAKVAHRLVRKGALRRLRRGSYLVQPFRSLGRATQPSTAVSLEALLRDEPHYLGGLWALSVHGFTEQRYASLLDAFVTHRLAGRWMGAARVRFHMRAEEAFQYGITTVEMEGLAVHVSDRERTFLDVLDHPRIFGGLGRALGIAREHLRKMNDRRLVEYAVRGSRPSTCQRLGVLLEREGVSSRRLTKLRARALQTNSLLSLSPSAQRTGPVNRRWGVVENDQ
jgi:predicted transcriptional regulator of viral defense system